MENSETMHKKEDIDQRIVAAVAGISHEIWRSPRWQEATKDFEPRMKKTIDAEWSKAHGGATEIDIANTTYENLPTDWQAETRASAEIAVHAVEKAIDQNEKLEENFIERASDKIHQAWLERNGAWAPPEQKLEYAQLSESEKEKDREYVRLAIKYWREGLQS